MATALSTQMKKRLSENGIANVLIKIMMANWIAKKDARRVGGLIALKIAGIGARMCVTIVKIAATAEKIFGTAERISGTAEKIDGIAKRMCANLKGIGGST